MGKYKYIRKSCFFSFRVILFYAYNSFSSLFLHFTRFNCNCDGCFSYPEPGRD